MGETRSIALAFRGRTRAGWVIAASLCVPMGVLSAWGVVALAGRTHVIGFLFVAGLAALYLWLGIAAIDVARAHPRLIAYQNTLVIDHRGLLKAPLVISRETIEAALVDRRPEDDRLVAARIRRGGIVRPSFLDARTPVLSAYPSAHGEHGITGTPNLVLRFHQPVDVGRVPVAPRILLRIGQGRNGTYRGPKSLKPVRGLRLLVADAQAAALLFASWDVLALADRDRAYLGEVGARHRARARSERLKMLVFTLLLVLVVGGLGVARALVR